VVDFRDFNSQSFAASAQDSNAQSQLDSSSSLYTARQFAPQRVNSAWKLPADASSVSDLLQAMLASVQDRLLPFQAVIGQRISVFPQSTTVRISGAGQQMALDTADAQPLPSQQRVEQGSTEGWRWTALLNSLMGESGQDEDRSTAEPATSLQVQQGVGQVTDEQPLGQGWIELTASMLKPAHVQPSQAQAEPAALLVSVSSGNSASTATETARPVDGGAAVEALASAVDDLLMDAAPEQDAQAAAVAVAPDREKASPVGSLSAAVRAAAAELAAKTGVSQDAAIDSAVSAVLQARNSLDGSLIAWERILPFPEAGAEQGGLAVPPESGPQEADSGGVLRRLSDVVSSAARSLAAMFKGRSAVATLPEDSVEVADDAFPGVLPLMLSTRMIGWSSWRSHFLMFSNSRIPIHKSDENDG
jgi:hypothetical protein